MADGGWEQSNPLFFLTPEIESMCKKADDRARGGRPQFQQAGIRPGLQIWRIELARAIPWPQHKYGKLHKGDSYIILNVMPGDFKGDKLRYDLHFWIGAESSEDEYGTAAFKTAGLDASLAKYGKRGAMHREVMDFESDLFLSYFEHLGGLQYLEGGIEGISEDIKAVGEDDSEDDDDEDKTISAKLYHCKGRKGMIMLTQVDCNLGSMNSGDVFILDADEAVYQWNGGGSNDDEREKAHKFASVTAKERLDVDGVPRRAIILTQGVDDAEEDRPEFWCHIAKRKKGVNKDLEIQEAPEDDDDNFEVTPKLFKLKSKIHQFSTGPYDQLTDGSGKPFRHMIKSTEVYVLDTGFDYLVWIGKDADPQLCKGDATYKVFPLTLLYIKRYSRPGQLPIHMYKEGLEPPGFFDRFDDSPYVPTKFEEKMDVLYGWWVSFLEKLPGRNKDVAATKISVQTDMKQDIGLSSAKGEKSSEFLDI